MDSLFVSSENKVVIQKTAPIDPDADLTVGQLIWRRIFFTGSALKHTWQMIRRNKLNYCLGFTACFVLVFVVVLVYSLLGQTPLIFLRLGEAKIGEIDLRMQTGGWSGFSYLNYTKVQEVVATQPKFSYTSPRYDMYYWIYAAKYCRGSVPATVTDPTWRYLGAGSLDSCFMRSTDTRANCVAKYCSQQVNNQSVYTQARVVLIDTAAERRMGCGREYSLGRPSANGLMMQKKMAQLLGVTVGDKVMIQVEAWNYFGYLWQQAAGSANASRAYSVWSSVHVMFTVEGIFDGSQGKLDSGASTAMFIDYDTFMTTLSQQLHPDASASFRSNVADINLRHYAQTVNMNLPPPRTDVYNSADFATVRGRVIQFTSEALYTIGFTDIFSEQRILDQLRSLSLFTLFVGLVMTIIITVLAFLSIALVYSLLMINVETRTFELGVMRMIGMSRFNIVQLLLTQAMCFALPAIAVALILAAVAYRFVAQLFSNMVGLSVPRTLLPEGIGIVVAIGIAVPILASILPIRAALSLNLHDSLDVRRSKTKAVKVSIERAEDGTVSSAVIVVGACLVVFGFLIYYFMPLALLSFNLSLLLTMFFFLLLGMLFGLVLLALNLQSIFERAVVYIFLFWERAFMLDLVLKNLIAHRERNQKTTMLFSMALGFIIFIIVAFSVSVDTFTYQEQQEAGVFMKIRTSGANVLGVPYQLTKRAQYEAYASTAQYIESYGWVSLNMMDALKSVRSGVQMTNIGKLDRNTVILYGISPNLFNSSLSKFLYITKQHEYPNYDLNQALYTPEGSAQMLVSSVFQSMLQLNLSSHFFLRQTDATQPLSTLRYNRLRPHAFLDGAPFFTFTGIPTSSTQDAIVSLPTFLRLTHGNIDSVNTIPMKEFWVKLKDGLTESQTDQVRVDLQRLMQGDQNPSVYDYRDEVDAIQLASNIMLLFFGFATVIVMLICFFSLVSSMYTNILEQTKEIAVLRALGMQKGQLTRAYVEEAFVIVFSASIMGLMIGIVIGYTMTVQRALFTALPIPFNFPWQIFVVVCACSFVFSLLSAAGPSRRILAQPIVESLRT